MEFAIKVLIILVLGIAAVFIILLMMGALSGNATGMVDSLIQGFKSLTSFNSGGG